MFNRNLMSSARAGLVLLLVALSASVVSAHIFNYQGKLTDTGSPANRDYDFEFKLYTALSGGSQVGSTLMRSNIAVTNGQFEVTLDFGGSAFPGADRFLEISVRPSGGSFTMLSPRQQILSAPYAIRSSNATSAISADGLSGACLSCVTSGQILSVQGSKITGTIPVSSVPARNGQ